MIRQKGKAVLVAGLAVFALCACGQSAEEDVTSVKIEKDGTVVNTIIEDFDESLYSVDALKNMVLSEAAAFNSSSGEKSIAVDKLEAADGKVTVAMTFAGASEYSEFNDKVLFFGTVLEGYEAGLDLDITLTSTQKDGGKIGKEEILNMGDSYMVILEELIQVMTPSKIIYASENVAVLSGNSAKVLDNGEAAYLILK